MSHATDCGSSIVACLPSLPRGFFFLSLDLGTLAGHAVVLELMIQDSYFLLCESQRLRNIFTADSTLRESAIVKDAVAAWATSHGELWLLGDDEREAAMTQQMTFEPLPASVLFGLDWPMIVAVVMLKTEQGVHSGDGE